MASSRVKFKRTQKAATQDRLTKWELIEAIAADADESGLPITSSESCVATKSALESSGDEYADGTVKELCVVAKFDYESSPKQRRVWRTYGWTVIRTVAKSGWTPEAAYDLLSARHLTRVEVNAAVRGPGHPDEEPSFEAKCATWVHRANALMMDGARLAEEVERTPGYAPSSQAELALSIYHRMTERQLDAEIRAFFESEQVR